MDLADILHRITLSIMHVGMPLVQGYHLLTGSVFLNVEAEDAKGLEKTADYVLTPVHYLFAGQKAVALKDQDLSYTLIQRFDYNEHFMLKTTASIAALPVSLFLGSMLKGAACILPEARARQHAIASSLRSTGIKSNNDYYRSLGMAIEDLNQMSTLGPPAHTRRPGDEKTMQIDKEALREVVKILKEKNIPFWADCGTCLGAYRYGGVIPWDFDIDLAVLEPDFENVRHALNELDHSKYIVQDWSGRTKPNTYLKVYVKETGVLIDIYHFAIDTEAKTLTYIVSNEDSIFLPESWKIRERRYTAPVTYDMVFPLKKAEFDGIEVLVPNKTKEYLQSRYGENIEPVKIYNEVTGRYEKDLNHPYWKLAYQK